MKLKIDEVFNEAIMSSTPVVIVEGVNDLKTYTAIARGAVGSVEVYPVELIDGFSPGCKDVIDAIQALYALNDSTHPVENFVLGVIDRDTREFRGELPTEQAIFALEYYSLESHFVSSEVLSTFLKQFTRTHESKFGSGFSRQLFEEIAGQLLDLYYFSLEALKCAMHPNYSADFQYSFPIARRKQQPTRTSVFAKRTDLDSFASGLGLEENLNTLMKVANGKWLLTTFCELAHSALSELPKYCGEFGSERCSYCRVEEFNKCTYRVKDGIGHKTLYSLASECWEISALDYVRRRVARVSLETVR
jgi:hypothetical protein